MKTLPKIHYTARGNKIEKTLDHSYPVRRCFKCDKTFRPINRSNYYCDKCFKSLKASNEVWL